MAFLSFRKAMSFMGMSLLFLNAAMAADSTEARFSENLRELLIKRNELLLKRLELEQKWLDYANRAPVDQNGDHVNTHDGRTSSKEQERKIGNLLREIRKNERELGLLKDSKSVRQLVDVYQRKNESQTGCELGNCLQMLDSFVKMGSQIALINERLIADQVSNFKSKVSRHTGKGSALELAIANIDLERSSLQCEQTMADLRYDSWVQPQGIAECFYSVTKEYEGKFGAPDLKTEMGLGFLYRSGNSFKNPQISIEEFSTGLEEALAADVMTLTNYSVRPEVLFRKAYELSRGNMYLALRTLYNTLRLHRTDLDFQRKLIDLRGDRPVKGRNGGDWYHFFGTMLAEQIFGYRFAMHEVGSDNDNDDAKKSYNNRAGVQTMGQLEALILGKAKPSKTNPCDLKNQLSKRPASEIK